MLPWYGEPPPPLRLKKLSTVRSVAWVATPRTDTLLSNLLAPSHKQVLMQQNGANVFSFGRAYH